MPNWDCLERIPIRHRPSQPAWLAVPSFGSPRRVTYFFCWSSPKNREIYSQAFWSAATAVGLVSSSTCSIGTARALAGALDATPVIHDVVVSHFSPAPSSSSSSSSWSDQLRPRSWSSSISRSSACWYARLSIGKIVTAPSPCESAGTCGRSSSPSLSSSLRPLTASSLARLPTASGTMESPAG